MPSFVRILATVVCIALAMTPQRAVASEGIEAAVVRAHAAELASRLEWLRLLHYGPTFFGKYESEIDGADFFLSRAGKHDPRAELDATLRAFDAPMVAGHEDAHALCRFPARRAWLDRELHFLVAVPRCPLLDHALATQRVERVSFVYASNYLGNPASAFGHAFLHLHVAGPAGASASAQDRIDLGAEFRGITTTKNPLAYAFMGMSGMFRGKVEVAPYETELERYSVSQGRDLWEYDLTLTREELTTLSLHLWELEATEADYYYMGRNCAFEVLRILEAAAPRLDLTSSLKVLVFPLDTLDALMDVPGLVQGEAYRPSRGHADQASASGRTSVPLSTAPSLGHGPMRVVFGTGAASQYGTGFATLGYRVALHDLTDPPDGWVTLSQVEILDARVRYDLDRRVVTLDRLMFADLIALHPLAVEPKPSWRVDAFGMRLHDRACADCFAHGLDGSLGATLATRGRAVAVFVMADAYTAFLPHATGFDASVVRLGVGPYAGVRIQSGQTVALLSGSVSYLPWSSLNETFAARLTLKSALGKNVALGLEGAAQPLSVEGQVASYVYF